MEKPVLSALFEGLGQGVVYLDAAGRVISANPAASRILGIPREQLLGLDTQDNRWRAIREDGTPFPGAEHPAMQVLATGQEVRGVVLGVFNPEDGGSRWLRVSAFPSAMADGKPSQVCAVFDDITDLKRAEAARSASECRCENLLRASPMGVHQYALRAGRLVFVGANPAADAILKVDHSRFEGQDIEAAFPGLRGAELPQRYRRIAEEGGLWRAEHVVYDDGVMVGTFDVHAFQTGPGAMAAVFVETSEARRLADALQKKVDELGALYAMSMEIGASLSVAEVKDRALQAVVRAVAPDLALLFSRQGDDLALTGLHSTDKALAPSLFQRRKVGQCLCGVACSGKRGVYSDDVLTDGRCTMPECKAAGVRSFAALPLSAGGEQVAVLAVASFAPRAFSAERVFLESIGGLVAASLGNAALHESLSVSMLQLERARASLKRILDAMPFGVAVVGLDLRLREANQAALAMMGYRADEPVAGRPCKEALCTKRTSDCPILDKHKTIDRTECEMLRRDGGKLPILKSAIPVEIDGEGAILETFVDITEIRQAREALERSRDELEQRVAERTRELSEANARLTELDALKSSFLSTVSHDLRTPLTSVLGFAKIIRREFTRRFAPLAGDDPALEDKALQIAGNLDIIIQEGERLTRLVSDFLDLSRLEEGRYSWQEKPVDLGSLLSEAAASVQGLFLERPGLNLRVEAPPDLPRLRLDPDRVLQVLVNLLSNAAKFTRKGTVTLAASASADSVRVCVVDTGMGLPQAALKRIFDKFYQVGDDTLKAEKGSGLGLTICKQIVEHYGGAIWAESEPGAGSTFCFELPLARVGV